MRDGSLSAERREPVLGDASRGPEVAHEDRVLLFDHDVLQPPPEPGDAHGCGIDDEDAVLDAVPVSGEGFRKSGSTRVSWDVIGDQEAPYVGAAHRTRTPT